MKKNTLYIDGTYVKDSLCGLYDLYFNDKSDTITTTLTSKKPTDYTPFVQIGENIYKKVSE